MPQKEVPSIASREVLSITSRGILSIASRDVPSFALMDNPNKNASKRKRYKISQETLEEMLQDSRMLSLLSDLIKKRNHLQLKQ